MRAFHTHDLDEATAAVAQVYCSHELTLRRTERALDTSLGISGSARQPVVKLRYGAAVSVDAGEFPRLFLVMACTAGRGVALQGGCRQEWSAGMTVPVSAGLGTQFEFDRDFSQTSVRLNIDLLESLCARWLGHPITQGVRFALTPFSPQLKKAWDHVLALMESAEVLQLSATTAASFEEFALKLLLHGHPHNFSDELREPVTGASAGLVMRAERFIEEHAAEPITVADVAAHINTGVRSLQAGFRSLRNTTPTAFLRDVRLKRVREELLHPLESTSVTQTALRWGFLHLGRFSQRYKLAFDESPQVTLRRGLAFLR